MPVTYRRPGVYLEESLLVNPSTSAGTVTVGCFVGVASKGPINEPTLCESWSEYVSLFGDFSTFQSPLPSLDRTSTAPWLPGAAPANLAALKSNVTYGDTHYAGTAFTAGQYVTLGDNSKASVTGGTVATTVWAAGPMAGTVPVATQVQSILPFSVYSFFQNGGRFCYIIRSVSTDPNKDGTPSSIIVNAASPNGAQTVFTITARSPGQWGNTVFYSLTPSVGLPVGVTPGTVFSLQVLLQNSAGLKEIVETFNNLSVKGDIAGTRRADSTINDVASGSQYIYLTGVNEAQAIPASTTSAVALSGGIDPDLPPPNTLAAGAALSTKIEGPINFNIAGYYADVSKINDPLATGNYVTSSVASSDFPDRQDVFIINDSSQPRLPNVSSASYKDSLISAAPQAGDSYVAVYAPWIIVPHPNRIGTTMQIPPGGAVMGMMARIDATVGVFRAPAGVIAVLANAVGVQTKFTDSELGDLNNNNINIIRSVVGSGICCMGGRTRKSYGTDHYVSARRTLIYIKEVLRRTTQFAVFENNDQRLWSALRMAADRLLRPLWDAGGLKGYSAAQAYYITCDDTINTPSVIASGEVRMEIGVALQYPAEFVIIRLTQFDQGTFTAEVVPAA